MTTIHEKRTISAYRKEGDHYLVELKLKTLSQLYNSLDPAPFHERDLDSSAADYIREAVQELGNASARIVVHLQEPLGPDTVIQVQDAIHHYFAYQARTHRTELRRQLRIGRISLLVGLLFLGFCIELSTLLGKGSGTLSFILREGFIIIGWVAMWKPLDIFLYSWWPILGEIRRYERIAVMPVEVRGGFCV